MTTKKKSDVSPEEWERIKEKNNGYQAKYRATHQDQIKESNRKYREPKKRKNANRRSFRKWYLAHDGKAAEEARQKHIAGLHEVRRWKVRHEEEHALRKAATHAYLLEAINVLRGLEIEVLPLATIRQMAKEKRTRHSREKGKRRKGKK